MKRIFEIRINLTKGISYGNEIVFTQGDNQTHYLKIIFEDKFDFNGKSMKINFIKPNRTSVFSMVTELKSENEIIVPNNALTMIGDILIEIVLIDGERILTVNSLGKFIVTQTVAGAELVMIPGDTLISDINDLILQLNEFMRHSKEELDQYTSDKKLELDNHKEIKKQELNTHTNSKKEEINDYTTGKEKEIDHFTEGEKVELTSHTDIKKTELTTYTTSKKGELDTYNTDKKQELNTHTSSKKEEINNHVTAKELEIDQLLEGEKVELTSHTNIKKTELDKYIVDNRATLKGDKGEKGDKGDTGPAGLQGEQGAQGIKGEKGDKGDTGPAGLQGEQGAQGIKGEKGDKGDTGPAGTTTWTGITGKPTVFPPAAGTITGNLTVTGVFVCNNDVTAFSDIRLKTNITQLTNALGKLDMINGYGFEYKDRVGEKQVGVIAQEVQTVLPEAVKLTERVFNGEKMLAVNEIKIVPLLIEAIKELKREVDKLKGGKE